jgi:ribosome maturation factor RimP
MGWASDETKERVSAIAERVAASEGMEIVEVECGGGPRHRVVRVFIDKPGGISHGDCEVISRQLGPILDVEDLVPGSYTLEVSSPGLDRKLLRPSDYERFAGRKARVELREAVEGRHQFSGRLRGYQDGDILLETAPEVVLRFRFEDVVKARLVIEV